MDVAPSPRSFTCESSHVQDALPVDLPPSRSGRAIVLLGRDSFADLSLGQKNEYLQKLAYDIALLDGKGGAHPLDKDALARLRRFYARRRISDLQLDKQPEGPLTDSFRRLADAIHLGEVKAMLRHEASPTAIPTLRDAPELVDQLDFFMPRVHDAPLKDDMNLMDIAPFSLSKNVFKGQLRYELKDCLITIEGGAEVGMANIYDYDIFIHMVSSLARAWKDYETATKKGLRPHLPPRTYRPAASEILQFCCRETGGSNYAQLEAALDRLGATRCKITKLSADSKRRATESFPLIGRYTVLSRTKGGAIDHISIEIPEWVYDGVITPNSQPSILTLNRDYFLISKPLTKFIYRLARKAAGSSGFAEYNLSTLHERSGSRLPFHKFKTAVAAIVNQSKTDPLPDYDLFLVAGKGTDKLRMIDRKKQITNQEAA